MPANPRKLPLLERMNELQKFSKVVGKLSVGAP